MAKREIVANEALVARCGLYCGACRSYLGDRCPGCRENEKAGWCKVRKCCNDEGFATCADCTRFPDPRDCPKFHNPIARVIGFLLRSDRRACILQVRSKGLAEHAAIMAGLRRQSLRPR